jgi:hypothetical protein
MSFIITHRAVDNIDRQYFVLEVEYVTIVTGLFFANKVSFEV